MSKVTWGELLLGKKEHKRQMRRVKQGKKKVYCKNCKWLMLYSKDFCQPHPFPLSPEVRYDIYFGEIETHYNKKPIDERRIRAYKINHLNNCPYYNRKWWKFWI